MITIRIKITTLLTCYLLNKIFCEELDKPTKECFYVQKH